MPFRTLQQALEDIETITEPDVNSTAEELFVQVSDKINSVSDVLNDMCVYFDVLFGAACFCLAR